MHACISIYVCSMPVLSIFLFIICNTTTRVSDGVARRPGHAGRRQPALGQRSLRIGLRLVTLASLIVPHPYSRLITNSLHNKYVVVPTPTYTCLLPTGIAPHVICTTNNGHKVDLYNDVKVFEFSYLFLLTIHGLEGSAMQKCMYACMYVFRLYMYYFFCFN